MKNNRILNLVIMMIISFSVIFSGCSDNENQNKEFNQDKEFIFEAPAHYGKAACLIKMDSSGTILSGHYYSSTPFFECNDLIQTSDGGYLLAGKGYRTSFFDESYFEGNFEVGSIDFPFACSLKVDKDGYGVKFDALLDEDELRDLLEGYYEIGYPKSQSEYYSVIEILDAQYSFAGYVQNPRSSTKREAFVSARNLQMNNSGGSPPDKEKTFSEEGNEVIYDHIKTEEGGYALAGSIIYPDEVNDDGYVIKLDNSGAEEWKRNFGGEGIDKLTAIEQTADGGYLISGYTNTYSENKHDVWVVKLDTDGVMEWNETYGTAGTDIASAMTLTDDGSFAVVGWSSPDSSGDKRAFLLRCDPKGKMEWLSFFDTNFSDKATSVTQTSDGGFAISGISKRLDYWNGDGYAWIIKTDNKGNKKWSSTFENENVIELRSVISTGNGDIVAGGYGIVQNIHYLYEDGTLYEYRNGAFYKCESE